MTQNLLSREILNNLENLLEKKHAIFINQRSFSISTTTDSDKVKVQVLLQSEDQAFYYPVEARMTPDLDEMTANESALFLIDYIDLYFEQFFEEGEELFLPIDWAKHNYDAIDFEIRGQIRNKKVEELADKILETNPKISSEQI